MVGMKYDLKYRPLPDQTPENIKEEMFRFRPNKNIKFEQEGN